MKIIAISGSNRDGLTNRLLKNLIEPTGFEYDMIELRKFSIQPCLNCRGCHQDYQCKQKDAMQEICQRLEEAECIILASPTYFDNVTGIMKNFMDRCLPYYFSERLRGKKSVLITIGGFPELIKYDTSGKCVWCQEGDYCRRTVNRCLDSLKFFAAHMGFDIIGSAAAIHGDPLLDEECLTTLNETITSTLS